MTLVDSSVWIDYFRDAPSREVDELDHLLASGVVLLGDLIIAEVLQGFPRQDQHLQASRLFARLPVIEIAGREIAFGASDQYRILRERGITVRKTIDTLIAARCIADGLTLLHRDRDFEPFAAHFGLKIHPPLSGLH